MNINELSKSGQESEARVMASFNKGLAFNQQRSPLHQSVIVETKEVWGEGPHGYTSRSHSVARVLIRWYFVKNS